MLLWRMLQHRSEFVLQHTQKLGPQWGYQWGIYNAAVVITGRAAMHALCGDGTAARAWRMSPHHAALCETGSHNMQLSQTAGASQIDSRSDGRQAGCSSSARCCRLGVACVCQRRCGCAHVCMESPRLSKMQQQQQQHQLDMRMDEQALLHTYLRLHTCAYMSVCQSSAHARTRNTSRRDMQALGVFVACLWAPCGAR